MKNKEQLLKMINSCIEQMDGKVEWIEEKLELERMAEDLHLMIRTEKHDEELKQIMQSELPLWMYKMYN